MGIIYRNYQTGDEKQLAQLFNVCFHLSGMGFCRTPNSILWRYVERPGFIPQEIQIAEDADTNQIVGSVYATIEKYRMNRQKLNTGCINDVAVHPNYAKRGIAVRLMNRAHTFFKQSQCHYSVLSADSTSFVYHKLYAPLGYKILHKSHVKYFLTPYILKIVPPLVPIIPYFLYIAAKIRSRLKNLTTKENQGAMKITTCMIDAQNTDYQSPSFQTMIKKLRRLFHRSMKHDWKSYQTFSDTKWQYHRSQAFIRSYTPSFTLLLKGKKIFGYSSFVRQWIYIEKIGLRFPLAVLYDWVIDPQAVPTNKIYQKYAKLLLNQTYHQALHRKCVALLSDIPISEQNLSNSFMRFMNAIPVPKKESSVYAVASLDPKNPDIRDLSPFFLGRGENFMYP